MSDGQSGREAMTDDAARVLEERLPLGHAIRQSHIRATGADPVGTHVTLTQAAGGFAVRWLDNDEDVTDTYPTLKDASESYEEMIRAFGPETDGRDESGDPVWDETDVNFRRDCPFCGEEVRAGALVCRSCRSALAPNSIAVGPALPPFSGMAIAGFILSLVWLGGAGSLVGMILCAYAMRETQTGRQAGRGLAVAGLILNILGLIVTGIILLTVMYTGFQLADQFNQVDQQLGR